MDLSVMLFQEVRGKSTPGNHLQTKRERNKLSLTVIPLLELIGKSPLPPPFPPQEVREYLQCGPPKMSCKL